MSENLEDKVEEEVKLTNKKVDKTAEPVWFNEKLESENMSQEEEQELESILNKYK